MGGGLFIKMATYGMNSFGNVEPGPLWTGGPTPGQLYQFPGNKSVPTGGDVQKTLSPVVMGSSVIAFQFKDGVIMAADMLGSYGSLARFRNCPRLYKVNDTTIIGASGDYADFQFLTNEIEQQVIDDECADDGFTLTPTALHSWMTRVLYNRRSQFNPLWNTYLVVGLEKKPETSQAEAVALIDRCMKLLYYRDARSLNKYQMAIVTKDGIEVKGPIKSDANWEIAHLVKGYE